MAKVDHFNLLGPIYDWIFRHRQDHQLVELVNLQTNESLLDVGGGTGRITILFTAISENLTIADSAANMIKKALEKDIDVVNTQSEHLPFASLVFDRIIMVDALHHVKNQKKSLQEMWRVLAPGGIIVIEEPDIRMFLVKLLALGEKLLLMRSHFLHPRKIIDYCNFGGQSEVDVYADKGMVWISVRKPY